MYVVQLFQAKSSEHVIVGNLKDGKRVGPNREQGQSAVFLLAYRPHAYRVVVFQGSSGGFARSCKGCVIKVTEKTTLGLQYM